MKEKDFPDVHRMEKIRITDVKRRRDNEAVKISESMEDLFEKITNQNFVPVVDDNGIFIGIVTRKDVLLYLAYSAKCPRTSHKIPDQNYTPQTALSGGKTQKSLKRND